MTDTEVIAHIRDKLLTEHYILMKERQQSGNSPFILGKLASVNYVLSLIPNQYAIVGKTSINQVEAGEDAKE